jgi:hypothetical protein
VFFVLLCVCVCVQACGFTRGREGSGASVRACMRACALKKDEENGKEAVTGVRALFIYLV